MSRTKKYQITSAGIIAIKQHPELPKMRDKDVCINHRYLLGEATEVPLASGRSPTGMSKVNERRKAQSQTKTQMRALSIRQPFAEQILAGDKEIEYRSRRTHIRGLIYIYACKAPGDADSYEEAGYEVEDLPCGVLVGTVEVVDCTGEEGDFEWHLANPQRLRSPLAVDGMPQPGFFWPFGHLGSVNQQVSSTQT